MRGAAREAPKPEPRRPGPPGRACHRKAPRIHDEGVEALDNLTIPSLENGPPDDPDGRSSEGGSAPARTNRRPVTTAHILQVTARRACPTVPGEVAALIEASIADRTRRAYRTDLAHFADWGGRLPAEPAVVASYLAAHAATLSVATSSAAPRRSRRRTRRGGRSPNPCRSEIVPRHFEGRQAHAGGRPARGEAATARGPVPGRGAPWARA